MEQTGTKLLHFTQSTWMSKGVGVVANQAQLRRIPEWEEIKTGKKDSKGNPIYKKKEY